MQACLIENIGATCRHGDSCRIGPAVTRVDNMQFRQAAVFHGPCRSADIFTHLRLHQDHAGQQISPVTICFCGIAVGAGHRVQVDWLFSSFHDIASASAITEASMILVETPTETQLMPSSSRHSISTRVTAPVPPLSLSSERIRTL